MSGGQQQRVAIARAIVGERRLILADEPTGALDTDTGEEILRLLRARCDAGAAGVMVTHEARHAAWADRVVFLRDGVVVDETGADEPETLLAGDRRMIGWRPALRIAWRDALRHQGRSILVLVMISLPVLAVSAAAVVLATSEVSGIEGAERRLGAADARVLHRGPRPGAPGARPERRRVDVRSASADHDDPITEDDVRGVLGEDARLLPVTSGWSRARLGDRVIDFSTTGVDLTDPLADGLFDLETGHLPEAPGEVVVNGAMLAKGFEVGDELEVAGGTLVITGAGRDATDRTQPVVLGSVEDLGDLERGVDQSPRVARRRRPGVVVRGARAQRDRRRRHLAGRARPTRPTSRRWPSRWATTPAATRSSRSSP